MRLDLAGGEERDWYDLQPVFCSIEICEVCHDWAKVMVDGDHDNPVFLKQVMENYKLKVKATTKLGYGVENEILE